MPAVVQALADGLVPLLGRRLVGVYLGGSYTLSDFVSASSDYDVLVVTADALTPADLEAVGELHQRLLHEYADAVRLEGDYAPRGLMIPQGTTAPVPLFSHGQFQADVDEIMLSADNIANIREGGITVYGPAAAEVLPYATRDDVRAAVLEMLWEGPDDPHTEAEAASEILGLVRSLRALETGRPTTKSEGVVWALEHLEESWHAVVRRANAVRRGAAVAEGDTELRTALPTLAHDLRRFYPEASCTGDDTL